MDGWCGGAVFVCVCVVLEVGKGEEGKMHEDSEEEEEEAVAGESGC